MKTTRKNYLITGASGFLGRFLLKSIRKFNKKSKVYFIYRDKIPLIKSQNLIPIKIDLKKIDQISKLKNIMRKIDVVIHCANLAHNDYCLDDIEKVNYQASLKLAHISKIYKVSKFIFLSTAKINMDYQNLKNKKSENDIRVKLSEDIYSYIKLKTEKKIKIILKNSFTNLYILRPALIYGEGAKGNLKKLKKLANLNFPLPIKLANNKKSFCSIDNITNVIIKISENKFRTGCYIVCDNFYYSFKEILERVYNLKGFKLRTFSVNLKLIYLIFKLLNKIPHYESMFKEMKLDNSKIKSNSFIKLNKNLYNSNF